MKKLGLATLLVAAAAIVFLAGWVLGTAACTAGDSAMMAQLAFDRARRLERQGVPLPDDVYSQIDAAVEQMVSAYPLLIETRKRTFVRTTVLKAADFRDTHPKWVQYYDGGTLAPDDRELERFDAILAKARKDWR